MPEVFLREFTVNITKDPLYVVELLEKAYLEKEANDVEYILIAVFRFQLYQEAYVDVLCKLMYEPWHYEHEDIALIFEQIKSPRTIECLYQTALTQFEYLEYDEAFALAVKCIWALGEIKTSDSIEKLKLLTESDNQIIKDNAINQLKRNRVI
jgi:hypothetical protein